jgi:hypothetical protein
VVDAVREGRAIYRNIQKFIFFLLSSNAGLAVAVFVVSFFTDWPSPTPLQILWINLVTNGLPALALGIDPPDSSQMKEHPRGPGDDLLGRREYLGIGFVGLMMGGLATALYAYADRAGAGVDYGRAMAFSLLALSPLFHAWSCRSPTKSVFAMRPFLTAPLVLACVLSAAVHLVSVMVPFLRPVFRTFAMPLSDWCLVVGLSLAIVPIVEVSKLFGRVRRRMHSGRKVGAAVAAILLGLLAAKSARADGIAIRLASVKPGEIKLDGIPREWPGTLTLLEKTVRGSAGGDVRMRGTVAYDDDALYVAGDINDEHFVRGQGCAPTDDHAELAIAFPRTSGGFSLYEVEIHPGVPGRVGGCAVLKGGHLLAAAKVIEAAKPVPGGLTFEARIPWSTFPEAARTRVGLRGALRYVDADGASTPKLIVGTSTDVPSQDLPRLPIDVEQSLEDGLLHEKGLTVPQIERFGDVAGDESIERVAVYDRFLVVLGPHYRKGTEYYFGDLGVDARAAQVPSVELRDVNGDGKAEILLKKRFGTAAQYREGLEILSIGADDVPRPVFQHEIEVVTATGRVTDELHFSARGKPQIEVAIGRADHVDAKGTAEVAPSAFEPALLPWGEVRSQTYEWKGSSFDKVNETRQAARETRNRAPADDNGASEEPVATGPQVAPPRPPTPDELQEQVYVLYRRQRRIGPHDKPRFDFAVDVAEDSRRERVVVHGRDLVVFGKGFKQGAGFAFASLEQFASPDDLADVTARDLTGDGKAEILVRGVVHAPAPKELGLKKGTLVDREMFVVYQVAGDGIKHVFAVETGRSIAGHRVESALGFVPGPHGVDLVVRGGRAFGWSSGTYPFNEDKQPVAGVEPLLLPWTGSTARYHWDGKGFSR